MKTSTNKENGMPAFAGMTDFVERSFLRKFFGFKAAGRRENGMPAFAGMTAFVERAFLRVSSFAKRMGLKVSNRPKTFVMPAKAGIPFSLVFKRTALLFFVLCMVAACAKEDVRESVSQSLKTMCRDNPRECTLDDPDSVRPDGKGAQR